METYRQDYPGHAAFEPLASVAIAALVIFGLLWGLVELAQSRGEKGEHLAAAEQACAHVQYQRDREACIKRLLHAGRTIEE